MRWRRRSDEAELFAFLEGSLEGPAVSLPLRCQAESVSRALELANDDWPEAGAAQELLLLVGGDRRVLYRLQEVFEGRMLRSMLPEERCLRAERLVDAALGQSYAAGTG